MKTPSLKLPHINVNKKWLLIGFGIGIVILLLGFATVKQVQADRQDKAVAAQEAARRAEADRSQKVRIASLEQQVEASKAVQVKLAAVCDYVRSTNAARRVAVPPLCKI